MIIHNGDYTEICLDEISDRMPELECLWLFGGHITDDNIRDISKCRNIKSILFWGIDRKPFDLTPLTKLDNLEELDLQRIFPQIDLTPLSDMSELKLLQCTVRISLTACVLYAIIEKDTKNEVSLWELPQFTV